MPFRAVYLALLVAIVSDCGLQLSPVQIGVLIGEAAIPGIEMGVREAAHTARLAVHQS